jgi:hypothetical protein
MSCGIGCLRDMIDSMDAPFVVTEADRVIAQLAVLNLADDDIDDVMCTPGPRPCRGS